MIGREVTRIQTVVIGGGQSGLAVGYHLARRELPFVILDAHDHIGDAWRTRWDSLRLFTPAGYDGLPGMSFGGPRSAYPTKDEMADYLQRYAERFALPVFTGVSVDAVARRDDGFAVMAGDLHLEADNVVVAMSSGRKPRIPEFAASLDPRLVQIHSHDYRRPAQLVDGPVLIVGAGNSGADIAMEVAARHATLLSGRDVGHIPIPINRFTAATVYHVVRFGFHHVLKADSRRGRTLKRELADGHGLPLVRVKPRHLIETGVERVPRTVGVHDGLPLLEDGRVCEVDNVIWCTGFRADFSWIDLPIFGHDREPRHERGVVAGRARPVLRRSRLPARRIVGADQRGRQGRPPCRERHRGAGGRNASGPPTARIRQSTKESSMSVDTDGDLTIESSDGTRLAASHVGSGSPLVLVHGALLGREAWEFVLPRLVDRHTVWVYDRRGHGRSDRAADMSIDREVEDLAAVVAAAGTRVHLVGHSFGARLGLEAARHLADLRSLVLYEPTVHFDRCEEALRHAFDLLANDDLDAFLEVFLTDIAATDPDELILMRSVAEGWALLLEAARSYRDQREAFAPAVEVLLTRRWAPESYPSIAAPTLLIMGALTGSPLFASADEIRATVANTQVVTLEGQRHMATVFDPSSLATQVLAFTRPRDPKPIRTKDKEPRFG